MNTVSLIGRLANEPTLRYTSGNQTAVATFALAIDRPARQGEEKKADFPRITVFGKQAETCEKYLSKGRKVAVEGRIQTGFYENKDGNTVYTTDVVANRVEFLEWGDKDGAAPAQPQAQAMTVPPPPAEYQQTMTDIPDGFAQIEEDVPF